MADDACLHNCPLDPTPTFPMIQPAFVFLLGPVYFGRIRKLVFVYFGSVVARVRIILGFLCTSYFLLNFPVRESFTCFVGFFNVVSEGGACRWDAIRHRVRSEVKLQDREFTMQLLSVALSASKSIPYVRPATALPAWRHGPTHLHPPRTA